MKKKAMLAAMAACLLSGNLAAYAPLNVLATDIKTTQDGFEAVMCPLLPGQIQWQALKPLPGAMYGVFTL